MKSTPKRKFLEQRHIPLIGEFKQLLGGAMSWVNLLIFAFSGIAAWNTDTMANIRDVMPWLNLGIFSAVIVVGILFAMWLEHKWIQPSVMSYWNKMHYDQNNPLKTDQLRTEQKVDLVLSWLSRKDPELAAEYRRLLDEHSNNGKTAGDVDTEISATGANGPVRAVVSK